MYNQECCARVALLVLLGSVFLGAAAAAAVEPAKPSSDPAVPSFVQTAEEADPAQALAFAQRDNPAGLQSAGRALLDMTWISSWKDHEFQRPGRWKRLGLVGKAMKADDYPAAIEAFKEEVLEKVRDDQANGLACLDPETSYQQLWKWMHPLIPDDAQEKAALLTSADGLLEGILIQGGNRTVIGPPGQVSWHRLAASDHLKPGWLDLFHPLLAGYIMSGERRYLDCWASYADDWAMHNDQGLSRIGAADIPDQWAGASEHMLLFFCYLKGVSLVPGGIQAMPAGTFTRVMLRLINDYLPVEIMYLRANPQNWTEPSIPVLYQLSLVLDEYRFAPMLAREARRRIELLTPTRQLPDGSDLDTTVGYSGLYLLCAGPLLQQITARRRVPDWMLPIWERETWRNQDSFAFSSWQTDIREHMRMRARFFAGHCQANGEWPVGGTRNDHSLRAKEVSDVILQCLPEAFADPDMSSLLSLANGPMHRTPSFLSDSLPYTGFSYLRSGWKHDDPYLFMHCAPQPTNGALGVRNNNAVGMAGYGADLIETGENGTYDQPHSPVRVDGQQQDFQIGISTWGHRHAMGVLANQVAPAWRWYTSAQFDLTEGVYAGPYGRQEQPIRGVTHQRVVIQVRGANIWLVIDRLKSHESHTYDLDWHFPIPPARDEVFTPEQITFDAKNATISTDKPHAGNIDLWQFATVPLTCTATQLRSPPQNHYRLHDFVRTSASWSSKGDQAVVTVIAPRAPEDTGIAQVTRLATRSGLGVEVMTANGYRVQFQTSDQMPAALALKDLAATGEALLLVEAPDHGRSGLVLGSSGVTLDGVAAQVPGPDFAYTLQTSETHQSISFGQRRNAAEQKPTQRQFLACMPFLATISAVDIQPHLDAFLVSQEIRLSCETPGVEIRYTTDGSAPGPSSPLYHGPFTISDTTTIHARALRPGLVQLPGDLSSREVSVVSQANMSRSVLHAATTAKTVPGLDCTLYQGRWQDLLLQGEALPPVQHGRVSSLFAQPQPAPPGLVAAAYHGFIKVPVDGLYTFLAPAESYLPSIFCGYELRIEVDGQLWYPATDRHALGTWSIGLAAGLHPISVFFADMRGDAASRINRPGKTPIIWPGTTPEVLFEGPQTPRGTIPDAMLVGTP